MITSQNKKYMPLAVLFGLLVAMGGIVWYGILPLHRSLHVKMKGLQEYYAGRENRERQVGKLPELQGQYDAIIKDEKALDILMSENEAVDFVKIIEKLAAERNVEMSIASKDGGKIVEPNKPVAKPVSSKDAGETAAPTQKAPMQKAPTIFDDVPFGRYLSLSVTVDGRYGDIVAFLRKVETLPFALDVVRIEMKKKEKERGSRPIITGSNPFFAPAENGESIAPVESKPAEEDLLEAVFDILVYVKKTDL